MQFTGSYACGSLQFQFDVSCGSSGSQKEPAAKGHTVAELSRAAFFLQAEETHHKQHQTEAARLDALKDRLRWLQEPQSTFQVQVCQNAS
jgi:hypothetical protein